MDFFLPSLHSTRRGGTYCTTVLALGRHDGPISNGIKKRYLSTGDARERTGGDGRLYL